MTALILTAEMMIGFGLPLALFFVWRRRTGASAAPAGVGAAVFLVFARILEQLLHTLVLIRPSPVQAFVTGNPWVYALYAALAAGIFEEMGRFCGFSLLRKHTEREAAVMYGIGHGGAETLLLTGFGMLANLALLLAANALGTEGLTALFPGGQGAALAQTAEAVRALTAGDAAWAVLERCSALAVQLSLSVFVFAAVRRPGRRYLLPLAVLAHAAADLPAGLWQAGVLVSLPAVEGIIAAAALLLAAAAWRLYRQLPASGAASAAGY